MDRLRSPGGCPWDAEQTHSSLRGYLLEEAHEAYDAIVDDDAAAMREELGDVLLQVVFHARVAAEAAPDRRFDVDDVAGDLVDKLVRRHPHVFGDAGPGTSRRSRRAGRRSRRRRSSAVAHRGRVPLAAGGLLGRGPRAAGRPGGAAPALCRELAVDSPEALGERLFGGRGRRRARGWDVEDALREAVRRYAGELDARGRGRRRRTVEDPVILAPASQARAGGRAEGGVAGRCSARIRPAGARRSGGVAG